VKWLTRRFNGCGSSVEPLVLLQHEKSDAQTD
jgi:hypothetical protein